FVNTINPSPASCGSDGFLCEPMWLVAPIIIGGSDGCKFNGDHMASHGQRVRIGSITWTQYLSGIAIGLDRADGFSGQQSWQFAVFSLCIGDQRGAWD